MPRIKEDCLRRVQDASDIVAIAESYGLKLRRVGSNFSALCPFHKEKTPSFNLNPKLQIFKCFGCGEAGGVIKFVQKMERCEFVEAVGQLAQRAGITLEYEGGAAPRGAPAADAKKPLYWANKVAYAYFRRCLGDDARGGGRAREYLRGRGFTDDTVNAWGLGWAPDEWDGLLNFCAAEVRRHSSDESKVEKAARFGVEAGVFRYNQEKKRTYDTFRGRVMFTIFDAQNRPVAFGGRVFEEKPDNGGKYINTPETPLFEKRKTLFGLNYAAKEIGASKQAIVVEGYVDTIMCHQHGIRNVVATLGTALTPEHVALLRRYVGPDGRVVALFDADEAGRRATERAVDVFMEKDLPLSVLQGLEVKDAGEFLPKFGAEKFREFLATAKDSFLYVLENHLGRNFGDDLAAKSAAVAKVMATVNLCPNAIRRQLMRQKVAELARVDENLLPTPAPARPGAARAESPATAAPAAAGAPGPSPLGAVLEPGRKRQRQSERLLLRYMAADANWCAHVADVFPPDEWHFSDMHQVAAMLRDAWQSGRAPDLSMMLLQTTDEDVRAVLIDLVEPATSPELTDEELRTLLQRIAGGDAQARRRALEERLAQATARGDDAAEAELLRELSDLNRKLRNLDGKQLPAD